MKKAIMIAAAVAVTAGVAQGRVLTAEEALARAAESWTATAGAKASGMASMKLVGSGGAKAAAWYLFSDGRESVVVSGDDCAAAVLGYIDGAVGSTDELAPGARYWLGEYAREIEWAQAHGVTAAKAPSKAQRAAIEPMLKEHWNQDAPYNNACPLTYAGQRCYTGCVATAIAQVMHHYRYPASGTGRVSYNWNNGSKSVALTINFAEVSFDWANMLDSYTAEAPGTAAQQSAVATLMQACGYSVRMGYGAGTKGSGTQSYRIREALTANFGYDKAMNMQHRDYFRAEEWDEMIYENLRTVGPCIYNGQGSGGGHSFVCDGYRADGLYHINWGWGGRSDGYFRLSALDPSSTGIGGGSGGFNYQQDALLGIRPPVAGSVAAEPYMGIYGDMKVTATRRQLTLFADGSQGGYYNMSGIAGTFNVAAQLTRAGAAPVYVTLYTGSEWATHVGFTKKTFDLPETLADGTYTLTPVYQVASSNVWKPMLYNKQTGYGSVEITVSGNTVTVKQPVSDDPEHVSAALTDGLEFKTGDTVTVTATLSNANSTEREIRTFLALCTAGGREVVANSAEVSVYIGGNAKAMADYELSVPDNIDPGTYELKVCAYFGDNAYSINDFSYDVTIKSGAGVDDITADAPSGPVTFYTLGGVALPGAPSAPGLYIRRTPSSASLHLVK